MSKIIHILFTFSIYIFSMFGIYAEEVNYLKPKEVNTGDCNVWSAIFVNEKQFLLACDNYAQLWQTSGFELNRLYEKSNTNWTDLLEGPENNYYSTILNDGTNTELWRATTDDNPILVSLYSKPSNLAILKKTSGKISSVLFVNKFMLVVWDSNFIAINRLNDVMKPIYEGALFPVGNIANVAIDTSARKIAIAMENSKHELLLYDLSLDYKDPAIRRNPRAQPRSFLSTARKMIFVSGDRLLAAVTDSGIEFRDIKDWSHINHVALSQDCTDMAYSKNRDVFIGICDDQKAYLFQHDRSTQHEIESLTPVHFVKFDWKSGNNRFAVVLDNGDVVLWKLIYEGQSDNGIAYYYPLKMAIMPHNDTVEKIEFGLSGQILTISGGKATLWDGSVFLNEREPVNYPAKNVQLSNAATESTLVSITLFFAALAVHTKLWE